MTIEGTPKTSVPTPVPGGGMPSTGTAGTGLPRHNQTTTGTDANLGTGTPVPSAGTGTNDGPGTGGTAGTGHRGTGTAGTGTGDGSGTGEIRCTCRTGTGTGTPSGTGTGTKDSSMIKAIDHGSMWPTSAIVGGFAAFGQHIFARMIEIPDPFAWFATGLFELVMISFLVRGWLRARKNLSPLVPWFVATAIGVVSIFVQLMHSTNLKQAVFYGVASGLVLLLWFTKLYDSYRQVLRDMGKIVTPIPKYGRMWILDFRRAWWGMRVGTAIQCDEIDVTTGLAWTYIATNRSLKLQGVRSDLRKITAWNAVYAQVGLPTIALPKDLQISSVGLLAAPPVPEPAVPALPAVPVPGTDLALPAGTAGTGHPVLPTGTGHPVLPTGTGTGAIAGSVVPTDGRGSVPGTGKSPRPPTYARAVPVSPAPAGAKPGWTPNPELLRQCASLVDDLVAILAAANDPLIEERDLRYYREDFIRLAVRTDPANPDIDDRWADGTWLTRPAPPTKEDCIFLCGRGGTHAMKIARIVKAIRQVHAQQN